jgi:tetratricopeptide (TPR) repeat protein
MAKGQLDEAIAEFHEAIRTKQEFPEAYIAHFNLGFALQAKGRWDEAIAAYKDAIRLKKDWPEAHCNLAGALEKKGQFTEALVYHRRGHELGSKNPRWPYPSAQWVRNCERLVQLDGKLPAILSGQKQPADAAERLALAKLCQLPCKQLYRATLRFYTEAFAAEPKLPDDLEDGYRYDAACAAVLVAAGQGKDAEKLDNKERIRLRRQALDWLRADLALWSKQMSEGPPQLRLACQRTLEHWQQDSDFASVRGETALAKLAADEQRGWRQLWADVEKTLTKLRQENKRQEKSSKK